MAKPTVVITNRPFPETVAFLETRCRVVANEAVEVWSRAELIDRLREATAMMAFMPDAVDEAFLAACPRLKMISCALKGWDNFDLEACARHGVVTACVPDLLTVPTAELAVGLTIGLARNVRAGDRQVRSGDFRGWRPRLYGSGLEGSAVGLLGAGAVGRATAQRLAGFGCQIRYYDCRPLTRTEAQALGAGYASLEELLASSDILIVCLPLNAETLHLVDRERIQRMKAGARLVNVSRGSVVDEGAVADALAAGHLAGYAADVFELEDWALPLRPRRVDPRLLESNAPTLFTPHLGSAVVETRREIERRAAHHIIQFFDGETPDGIIRI